MERKNKPGTIEDNILVSLDYTLKIAGQVVDTSENSGPLEFVQGKNHILPGLERALYGMSVGESKQIILSPQDGYGEIDPQAVIDVPLDQFPADIPLEVGLPLQVQDTDGSILDARILKIGTETIQLDFNHPLAGQELHFEVKVVDLREPTPEEMEQGQADDEEREEV